MLKLLHRHVLKEILVATGLAMGLFVFVLLMGNAMRDIVGLVASGKLGVVVFLKLMGLLIPYVASYALPLGMLTGTLMALGRLSAQQEITAMKAAGISLYRIAAPVFLISFVAMIAGVVVNLHFAPQSRLAYKQLMLEAISDNPISFIEEKRFIQEFPGYVIYMGERDGSIMKDFWIWVLDDDKRVTRFIRADEGELDYSRESGALALVVRDAVAEDRSGDDVEDLNSKVNTVFFEETSFELPINKMFGDKGKKRRVRTKEMTFFQLMELREEKKEIEVLEGTGISKSRMKIQVLMQKNFAMAFSVFSLAVFGVPLAIHVGRKESYANLAIALVIGMSYYFLIIMVSWLGSNAALRPDLLMWLPNIIFQSVGFYMIHRANQH